MEVSSGRALDLFCSMGVRGGGRGGFDDYYDDNREREIISKHEDTELIFYRIPQLSRNARVDTENVRNWATVLWWVMKETLCIYELHMSSQADISQSLKTARLRCGWRGSWFEYRRSVQTGIGTQPVFYPVSNRDPFASGRTAGAWSWRLFLLVST
jgi:hypothetical protein